MKISMMRSKKLQKRKNKHIYLNLVLVVLLFGRGKISSLMGDVAKGIKSFKKGMSDDASTTNQEDKSKSDNSDSENK